MTDYAPILVDAPAVRPVTVEECKRHLRVTWSDEDEILQLYLDAVINYLDGATGWLGRTIVAQTWSQQFDRFSPEFRLSLSPVTSIVSIGYVDGDGVDQTVSDESYTLLNGQAAPIIRFIEDFDVPGTTDERPAVTVTFVGGYGDETAVPPALKAGIFLMVADLYQQREAKVESSMVENSTAGRLLNTFRTRWVA